MKLKKEKDSSKPWGWIKAIPTEDSLVNQFAWKDNEIVLFITTVFSDTSMVIRLRKRPGKANSEPKRTVRKAFGDQWRKKLPIPTVIDAYNHNMNGVDVGDQLRAEHRWQHRWKGFAWRPLAWGFLLDTVLVNSC